MDPTLMLEGRTRETAIRRDAAGRWWNGDDRIEHPNLVTSFDGWIDRADDGRYCLANDINWAYVAIEGPPYFVRTLRRVPGGLDLHLSGERVERLDPASLRQADDGAVYCDVRGGRCAARFDSHAAVQLEDLLGEDEQGVYLSIDGARHRVPLVADPLSPRVGTR